MRIWTGSFGVPSFGKSLMVIYGALALLAITPGTTCVLLGGLGIGHFHLGQEQETEREQTVASGHSHSHHHHHHSHGHSHSHTPKKRVSPTPPAGDPLPCPDAVGISLESEYTIAQSIELNDPVWILASVAEWSEEIVLTAGRTESGGRYDSLPVKRRGSPGENRVLFCSFLI